MATLKALVDETTNIKNDTINCHTVLKNNLINKKVSVSSSDKMLDLVNKIPDIKAFPVGWDVEKTGEVFNSNITEGDPIMYQKYGSWDTQIDLLVEQPDVSVAGIPRGNSFSPDGKYLAVAHDSSPGLSIYKVNGDTFTKLPNPVGFPDSSCNDCAFSPNGKYLVVVGSSAPHTWVYRIDSGDVFTKLTTPPLIYSTVYCCAFSPDSNYLALGYGNGTYLKYYKREGDTFTSLSIPTISSDVYGVYGVSFSPDGKYLACALYSGNHLRIYKRSGDTISAVFYASTSIVGNSNGCSFSPDGRHLVIVGGSKPYMATLKNNGDDTFTMLPNPDILPSGRSYNCAFSPDGKYLALASSVNNPRLVTYKIDGDTYTKTTSPSVVPSYDCYCVAFNPNGNHLAIGYGTSPYQYIYRTTTKDIVSPYNASTFPLQKLSIKNVGVAMESKNIGEQVKVNLFPKLNIL